MSGDWSERKARSRNHGEPVLVPHFPITPFVRAAVVRTKDGEFVERPVPCPHKRRYKRGSQLVCMLCHQSGMDHLGVMARDPRTDPKPEPKVPEAKPPKLTRKELRALRRDCRLRESSLTPTELEYLEHLGIQL